MSAFPAIHRFPTTTRAHSSMPTWSRPRRGSSPLTGCCRSPPPRRCAPVSTASGSRYWPPLSTHSPRPLRRARRGRRRRRRPDLRTAGVIDTITADDAVKDQIVGPLFGEDWPANRVFPNTAIADGESVSFDEVTFTVIDLGLSESPHDSPWILGDDAKTVFLGDQIYDHKHCYLGRRLLRGMASEHRDVTHALPRRRRFLHRSWRAGRRRDAGLAARVHRALRPGRSGADWFDLDQAKAAVVGRMKAYEPSDELQILMELSVEPIATKLGLLAPPA